MPESVYEAINNRNLIIFLGAGVSRLAGLPSWRGLAEELIDKCKEYGYMDDCECDLLKTKIDDSKKLITIAYQTFIKDDKEKVFYEIFSDLLTPTKEIPDNAKKIFKFCEKSDSLILTTNADKILDDYYHKRLVISDINDFNDIEYKFPFLIKIHGTIDKPETLVFTTQQYLKRYSNNIYKEFLKNIFKNHCVLFIGYGLGEFEILEYLLDDDINNGNIYVINDYYSYEYCVKKNLDIYYKSININQIAYNKDKNGFNQLPLILEKWTNVVENDTLVNKNIITKIDEILSAVKNDYDLEYQYPKLLHLIKQSIPMENHFFSTVSRCETAYLWTKKIVTEIVNNPDTVILASQCQKDGIDSCITPINTNVIKILEILLGNSKTREGIMPYVKNYIECIVSYSIKNKDNIERVLWYNILSLFTKLPENCIGNKIDTLFNCVNENNEIRYTFFILYREDSNFLSWDEGSIITAVYYQILSIIKRNNDISNTLFYKNIECVVEKICNEKGKIIFKKIDEFLRDERNKLNLTFMSIGAISKFALNRGSAKNIEILLYLFKKFIEKCSYTLVSDILGEEIYENATPIINKFIVYSWSCHFVSIEKIMESNRLNPFCKSYLFSDMYCLIENNISKYCDADYENTYKLLSESNLGLDENSESVNNRKQGIILLLSKRNSKFKSMLNQEIEDELDSIDFYNLNSVINPNKRSIRLDDDYERINTFNFSTIKEINEYLSQNKSFSIYKLADYIAKNDDIIYRDIDEIKNIPDQYLWIIAEAIDINNCKEEQYISILFVLFDLAIESLNTHVMNILFNELRYRKISNNKLFEKIKNSLQKTKEIFENTSINCDYQLLSYNIWYLQGISVLISLLDSRMIADDDIKSLIEVNEYKGNTELIRLVLAQEFNHLYNIDREYALKRLDVIFLDVDAFIMYAGSMKWYSELFDYFISNGIIEKYYQNIDEDLDNNIRKSVSAWIAFFIIRDNSEKDIVKSAFESGDVSSLEGIFMELKALLNDDSLQENAKSFLNGIYETVNDIDMSIYKDKNIDFVIEDLSDCMAMLNEVDSNEWLLLENLIVYIKDISENLASLLYERFEENTDIVAEIVLKILENMEVNYVEHNFHFSELLVKIKNKYSDKKIFYKICNAIIRREINTYNSIIYDY